MYDYYRSSYEARERIEQRRREAEAERIIRRQGRARQRGRRAQLALEQLIAARRAARLRA